MDEDDEEEEEEEEEEVPELVQAKNKRKMDEGHNDVAKKKVKVNLKT